MAIQLCPVDTANVHPRNILGSSSSFDRERLSPFGSLSAGKLWSTSPSAPGRPSLVANPARKLFPRVGTLSSIARTPPAVASRRYARTGGQRKTSGKLHVCARVSVASGLSSRRFHQRRRQQPQHAAPGAGRLRAGLRGCGQRIPGIPGLNSPVCAVQYQPMGHNIKNKRKKIQLEMGRNTERGETMTTQHPTASRTRLPILIAAWLFIIAATVLQHGCSSYRMHYWGAVAKR